MSLSGGGGHNGIIPLLSLNQDQIVGVEAKPKLREGFLLHILTKTLDLESTPSDRLSFEVKL